MSLFQSRKPTLTSSLSLQRLAVRPQRYNRHNISNLPNGRAAKPAGGARPASSIPAFPAPPRSLFSRVSMVERARRRQRRPWCGRVGPTFQLAWAGRGAEGRDVREEAAGRLGSPGGGRRVRGVSCGRWAAGPRPRGRWLRLRDGGSGAARAPGPGAPAGSLDPAAGPGGSASATLRAPGFGLVASGWGLAGEAECLLLPPWAPPTPVSGRVGPFPLQPAASFVTPSLFPLIFFGLAALRGLLTFQSCRSWVGQCCDF